MKKRRRPQTKEPRIQRSKRDRKIEKAKAILKGK